ncbi:Hypothetical predicted protein [Mytilus galloprovincialis]|uniref:Uncharacterized protein n=1 Tax=Mytilus galloprovincialis TaxID=29158 RepID=A0A8B6BNH6_MYTGA|nr:Hypothetical predicted protein [Mytilus galloprovincialis]
MSGSKEKGVKFLTPDKYKFSFALGEARTDERNIDEGGEGVLEIDLEKRSLAEDQRLDLAAITIGGDEKRKQMKVPAKISTKRKLVVGQQQKEAEVEEEKAEEENYQEKERGMSPCQTHLITVLREKLISLVVKEEIKLFKKKRKAATCSTPSVSSETLTLQDQSIFSEHHGECSGQIEVLETVELHSQEPPNFSLFISHIFRKRMWSSIDDKNDLTFDIDRDIQRSDENEENESTDSDDSTAASDTQACITNQRKCIVFEKQLDQLFARLKCDECNCPVDLSDTKKDCSSGTIMRVSVFCTSGHLVYKWLSQPLIGNMPAVNLLVTAATMLCGQTFTHIAQFAEFMNLKFIGSSTYYTIQREIVMPVIAHTWTVIQGKL